MGGGGGGGGFLVGEELSKFSVNGGGADSHHPTSRENPAVPPWITLYKWKSHIL